jgi:HAD superfamily hydrolase (TIGR01509 family)
MNYKFDAIIWDCDGVLIDSEILSCSVSVDFLKEYGVDIKLENYIDEFLGCRFSDTICTLEGKTGVKLTKLITQTDIDRRNKCKLDLFEKKLRAIPNVDKVLENLELPKAVASGSYAGRLNKSLSLTNLKHYFEDEKICSSDFVEHGKPEPDVFLFASKKLGIKPEKCLVIEDSPNGIIGAKKAGMSAFGFTGASHMTPKRIAKLKDVNADYIFSDMLKLDGLIKL